MAFEDTQTNKQTTRYTRRGSSPQVVVVVIVVELQRGGFGELVFERRDCLSKSLRSFS